MGTPAGNDPAASYRWVAYLGSLSPEERVQELRMLERDAGSIPWLSNLVLVAYVPRTGAPPPPVWHPEPPVEEAERVLQRTVPSAPFLWIEGLPFAFEILRLTPGGRVGSALRLQPDDAFLDWARLHGRLRSLETPPDNPLAALARFESSGRLLEIYEAVGREPSRWGKGDGGGLVLHTFMRRQAYNAISECAGSIVRDALGFDPAESLHVLEDDWRRLLELSRSLGLYWDSDRLEYRLRGEAR